MVLRVLLNSCTVYATTVRYNSTCTAVIHTRKQVIIVPPSLWNSSMGLPEKNMVLRVFTVLLYCVWVQLVHQIIYKNSFYVM